MSAKNITYGEDARQQILRPRVDANGIAGVLQEFHEGLPHRPIILHDMHALRQGDLSPGFGRA